MTINTLPKFNTPVKGSGLSGNADIYAGLMRLPSLSNYSGQNGGTVQGNGTTNSTLNGTAQAPAVLPDIPKVYMPYYNFLANDPITQERLVKAIQGGAQIPGPPKGWTGLLG